MPQKFMRKYNILIPFQGFKSWFTEKSQAIVPRAQKNRISNMKTSQFSDFHPPQPLNMSEMVTFHSYSYGPIVIVDFQVIYTQYICK